MRMFIKEDFGNKKTLPYERVRAHLVRDRKNGDLEKLYLN